MATRSGVSGKSRARTPRIHSGSDTPCKYRSRLTSPEKLKKKLEKEPGSDISDIYPPSGNLTQCNRHKGVAMLEVKLTPEMETALSAQAKRSRKSKATLVRNAVAQYLQDAADYQAVTESRKRRGRTHSLAQIKQRLGLDS
ncbi:MAG: hypothetical protein WCG92_03765 [Hyphomicrobiales bacterium]